MTIVYPLYPRQDNSQLHHQVQWLVDMVLSFGLLISDEMIYSKVAKSKTTLIFGTVNATDLWSYRG